MARELLVTLGLNATSYTNNMRRIKALTKELDKEFSLTKSSVEGFEKSLEGLARKSDYLATRTKYLSAQSELYINRIHESANELEKAQKETVQYTQAIKDLQNKMKGLDKGSEEYAKASKELKGLNQLLGKAEKRTTTYNQRILDTKANYAMVETEIQKYSKELQQVGIAMEVFDRTEHLAKLNADLHESDESFKRIKGSVHNFGQTMTSLETTQQHCSSQQEKINTLMGEYTKEIGKSKSEIDSYKQKIAGVKSELDKYEQKLKETNTKDEGYKQLSTQVGNLRKEYSELNAVVEFYEDRMEQAESANKELKNTFSGLEGEIDKTRKAMAKLGETQKIEKLENELKQLKSIGSSLDSSFEVTTSKVSKFGFTLGQLTEKEIHLSQKTKNLEEILGKLGAISDASRNKISNLKNEQQQLTNELKESKEVLKNLRPQDVNYEEMSTKVLQTEQRIKELNSEIGQEVTKLNGLQSEIKQTSVQFNGLSRELKELDANKFMHNIGETQGLEKLERKLQGLKNKTQELDNTFEITSSKFANFGNTLEQLAVKKQYLIEKVQSLENTMKQMNAVADGYSSKINRLTNEEKKLNNTLTEQKAKLETLNPQSVEYEKLSNEVYETQIKMEGLNREIFEEQQKLNSLQGEIAQTSTAYGALARDLTTLNAQFLSNKLESYGTSLRNIGQGFSNAGMAMMPISMGLGVLSSKIIKTGAEFQAQMSRVGALTGETGSKLKSTIKELGKGAKELASNSKFTATEVASGLENLVLAGYNAKDSLAHLPIIMKFAQAGAVDLKDASEDLITSMNSLGKNSELTGKPVENMSVYANQLAITANRTSTDVDGMARSIVKVGGQAENLHMPLSTLNTLLGILGDGAVDGEEAGNALNSVLINLTKEGGDSAKALEKLGLSAFDMHGNIKPIEQTLGELQLKLKGMSTDKQEILLKNMLGGKVQAKTLMKLLQGIDEKTGKFKTKYADLKKELEGNIDPKALKDGTTALDEMARAMNDNLMGDWTTLKSKIENLAITIFEDLQPALRKTTKNLIEFVQKLTKAWEGLSPKMKEFIFHMTKLLIVTAPILLFFGGLITMVGNFMFALKNIVDFFGIFKKSAKAVGDAGEVIAQSTNKYSKITDALMRVGTKIKTVVIPAILTPLRSLGGKITTTLMETVVPAISGAFSGVMTTVGGFITETIIPAIAGAFSGLGTAIGGVLMGIGTVIMDALGAIGAFISGAWIPIVIGVAIAGLVALIVKYWDEIKSKSMEMWDFVSNYVGETWSKIKDKASEIWSGICDSASQFGQKIADFFKQLPSMILEQLNLIIDTAIAWGGTLIGSIAGVFVAIVANISVVFNGIVDYFSGFFTLLEGIFTLNGDKIVEGLTTMVMAVVDTITTFISNSWNTIIGFIDNFAQLLGINFQGMVDKATQWCSDMINTIVQWGIDMGTNVATAVGIWWNNLTTGLGDMWNSFWAWCGDLYNQFTAWLDGVSTFVSLHWDTMFQDFGNWCLRMLDKAIEWFLNMASNALTGMSNWAKNIKDKLNQAWNDFLDWCGRMIDKASNWVSNMVEKAKTGFERWKQSIKDKLNQCWHDFVNWGNNVVETLQQLPGKLYDIGKKMVSSIWDGFKSKWSSFKGWVVDSFNNIKGGLKFDAEMEVKNKDFKQPKLPAFNATPTVQTPMTTGNTTDNISTPNTFRSLLSFGATSNPFASLIKDTFDVSNFKVGSGEYEKQAVKIETSKQTRNETDGKLVDMLIKQNQLLTQLLLADRTVEVGLNVDGRQIAKASAKYMETEINTIKNRNSRLGGAF